MPQRADWRASTGKEGNMGCRENFGKSSIGAAGLSYPEPVVPQTYQFCGLSLSHPQQNEKRAKTRVKENFLSPQQSGGLPLPPTELLQGKAKEKAWLNSTCPTKA